MSGHWYQHWENLVPLVRDAVPLVIAVSGASVAAYRKWASFSWPEVEGTVQSYRLLPFGRTNPQKNGISFSYAVEGEYYAGELKVTRNWQFPKTEEDMERLYPKGSNIRVRHNPGDPAVYVAFKAQVPHKSVYFAPRDDPR
jgi:uncharacterized protein DUF3592